MFLPASSEEFLGVVVHEETEVGVDEAQAVVEREMNIPYKHAWNAVEIEW